ncbi:MAG: aminopeptidase, partial [Pseudomonadales bacterium]|nr:aminopeptidase [Pseudomonadales bacterium]
MNSPVPGPRWYKPACFALLVNVLLLSGCESLAYYHQAVFGHLALLNNAEPIEQLLDRANAGESGTASDLQDKLLLVQALRAFARDELGLPVGRAYSRYVELERNYVVWNVFASEEFSITPKQWCFPVAGCVAYRGYFKRAHAEKKAASLANNGLDTYVAGAAAYSTLGWTADPVLSTFVERDEVALASLLFHELSHRLVYIKGDTEFNESLASSIESYALGRWLAMRTGSQD